jgi:hypothetical protein
MMNPITGQIVRTLGLLIEMLGIFALVFRTRTDQAGVPLPGSFPLGFVWAVVGIGFVVWLVGTVMIYWMRQTRARRKDVIVDDGDLNL